MAPMPQSDYQLLLNSRYYPSASILLMLLAVIAFFNGQYPLGIVSALLCGTLSLGKKALSFKALNNAELSPEETNLNYRKHLKWGSLVFSCLALTSLIFGVQEVLVWLYAVPLLIFFFFEFKPAVIIIVGLSLVTGITLHNVASPLISIQFVSSYSIYLAIGGALVYLREVRRKQLKPLRKTDNLTQAATREHLGEDLTKEIQRSEREGSELAVMALGIDENCLQNLGTKQRASIIIDLGKLLHNNLRVFDSYYLWDDDEFLVVLPHTSSSQANKIANELRMKVRKEMSSADNKITISAGIAGLNVGDDSKALTQKAADTLDYSMRKGHNRTQLYRDETPSEETRSNNSDSKPSKKEGKS